jgi:hypothetical protein
VMSRGTAVILLESCLCPRLETIQEEIGYFTNLTSLRIPSCENLETLPEQIGELIHLNSLRIFNCKK